MRYLLLLVILFSFGPCFGQYEFSFDDVEYVNCKNDRLTNVFVSKHYEIYQTTNDNYGSSKLKTGCISLKKSFNVFSQKEEYGIDLSTVDLEKKLFVRVKLTDDVVLSENKIYQITAGIANFYEFLEKDSLSVNNFSKIIFREEFDRSLYFNEYGNLNFCLPTGSEEKQFEELLYSISFNSLEDNKVLFLKNISIDIAINNPKVIVDDITVNNYDWVNEDEINIYVESLSEEQNPNVILDKKNTSQEYINLTFNEVFDRPIKINLIVEENNSIHFRNNIILRASTVSNNSIQHNHLNIVIKNPDKFCLGESEIMTEGLMDITLQDGKITWPYTPACFIISKTGKLIVPKNSTVTYGEKGIEVLLLHYGSKIVMNENSKFIFNGELKVQGEQNENVQSVDIILPFGTEFIFGKNAQIESKIGVINFHMNGGRIDYHNLSPIDKHSINLIFPRTFTDTERAFSMFPNPVSDILIFYNQSKNENATVSLYEILSGQLIQVYDPVNSQETSLLDVTNIQSGIYVAKTEIGKSIYFDKIIIAH